MNRTANKDEKRKLIRVRDAPHLLRKKAILAVALRVGEVRPRNRHFPYCVLYAEFTQITGITNVRA